MPEFTVYNKETGQVRCTGRMATEAWCLAQAGEGEAVYLGTAARDEFIREGVPVAMPAQPSEAHVFDWQTHAWYDPRTVADLRSALKADIAQRRWALETGGLTLPSGLRVKTGREDRAALVAAVADLEAGGAESLDFKSADGFVSLAPPDAQNVLYLINEHVRECFAAERAHCDLIDSLTDRDTLVDYPCSGFPALPALED